EAKGKRQVKRLCSSLRNFRNIHSWSFWHTFNQSLRKVGVKPWLLRDINSVYINGILPVHWEAMEAAMPNARRCV
ncbi:MAG: hypothetical protein ACE5PV_21450, partial [Candidatus Poribacteria bacterium]